MGGTHPKPIADSNDIVRSLKRGELQAIQSKFQALAKTTDHKTGKIDKPSFVEHVLAPVLTGVKLGAELTERVFFVLDFNGAQSSVDWPTFLHACYLLMYSARDEKYKFVFNLYDLSATGRLQKKEFRKMAQSFMQGDCKESDKRNRVLNPLIDAYTNWCFHVYDKAPADAVFAYSEWRYFAEDDDCVAQIVRALKPPAVGGFTPPPVVSVATATPATAAAAAGITPLTPAQAKAQFNAPPTAVFVASADDGKEEPPLFW